MNNNVQRKCIVTNKIKDTKDLIRIVKTKSGQYFVNSDAKGRGAYISNDPSIIEDLKRKRFLNRSFKTQVPEQVYIDIEELFNK